MTFEFKLPDIGEGVVEGEIVRWLIQQGDQILEDQPLVEVMTDKATVELPSPVSGKIVRLFGKEGDTVEVGATLVEIETGRKEAKAIRSPAEAPARKTRVGGPLQGKKESGSQIPATPAVRRRAREMGIDLSRVEGTGGGGRVTLEDLEKFQIAKSTGGSDTTAAPTDEVQAKSLPYRGIRKKIGGRLQHSKRTVPHYTYVEEANFTELVRLRRRLAQTKDSDASRVTYLPFIIKAVVESLKSFPILNASLDEDESVIQLHQAFHIGIAVATGDGLVVPVIKHADRKGLFELADEILTLSNAARDGKLKLEDLQGGTFTITSLGNLGGVMATPIINYPEVAILGVHRIAPRPIVQSGQIVAAEMANLSLSLDHRVVDGLVGAEFLRSVISFLESPGLFITNQ